MDMSLDITRALKLSIQGLPKDWRRPPGRPRHIWLRTLDADLQPHNFGLNSAWKYTHDREYWKHLVETAMLQLVACTWRFITLAVSESTALELSVITVLPIWLKTKCLPVLYNACPLNRSDIKALDCVLFCSFIKILHTNSKEVVDMQLFRCASVVIVCPMLCIAALDRI